MGDEEWKDPRADFMAHWVLDTTKQKMDKWQKMIAVEEYKQALLDFFDQRDQRLIVFLLDAKGVFQPLFEFPSKVKAKGAFFIKQGADTITKDNYKSLYCGDLSTSPVDQVKSLVEGVLMPILRNTDNNAAWPAVVTTDVSTQAQALNSTTEVLCGRMKGQMPLPMPAGAEVLDEDDAAAAQTQAGAAGDDEQQQQEEEEDAGEEEPEKEGAKKAHTDEQVIAELARDKSMVHAIESGVIEWTRQIREVLKRDSAQLLMDGQHPTALVELDFWAAKCKSLQSLHSQLTSARMKKMQAVLDHEQSSYAAALRTLQEDVHSALEEATDISAHLEPLRRYLESIEETPFEDMEKLLTSAFHTVELVWRHAKHYATPRHIVVLLREMMNQIIVAVHNTLEPRSVFSLEVDEGIVKPQHALKLIALTERLLADTRASINTAADQGECPPWKFETRLVLARLDEFKHRVTMILELFEHALDFFKLEKVEVSSEKLNRQLKQMYDTIVARWEHLGKVTGDEGFDCLDPVVPDFEEEYKSFMELRADFDYRIGAIALQSFEQCVGLEGAFKLIHGFMGLLDRADVIDDVGPQYPRLLTMYEEDLDTVKSLFDDLQQQPLLAKNMPDTAGRLRVLAEFRQRTQRPRDQFVAMNHPLFQTAESERIFAKHDELLALFKQHEAKVFEEWASSVGERSEHNLALPLLVRDPDTFLIHVNFDPQLVAVLREVKYLQTLHNAAVVSTRPNTAARKPSTAPGTKRASQQQQQQQEQQQQEQDKDKEAATENGGAAGPMKLKAGNHDIPDSATAIFARNEQFHEVLGNLNIAVTEYNRIQEHLLDVEAPLVEQELAAIDAHLERGINELNWNSSETEAYCLQMKEVIEDLSDRLSSSKTNVEVMTKDMAEWYVDPLFVRDHKSGLLQIQDRTKLMAPHKDKIRKTGLKFIRLLEENRQLFGVEHSDPNWQAYVDFVDQLVLNGLYNVVHVSMAYLLDRMEGKETAAANAAAADGDVDTTAAAAATAAGAARHGAGAGTHAHGGEKHRPLQDGKMSLIAPEICFEPGINDTDPQPSLLEQNLQVVSDFLDVGSLFPRLSQHAGGRSYREELADMEELMDLQDELESKVNAAVDAALELEQTLRNKYEHLWRDDMDDFLEQFLKYGHVLTQEEIEAAAEEGGQVEENPPTLEQFQENIDKYNAVAEEVKALDDSSVFDGWLVIDSRSFKYELYNIIKKWSFLFLNHLQTHVTSSLNDLQTFIESAKVGLTKEVPEGDYDALVGVMGYLNALTSRAEATDAMFGPLGDTVKLLNTYEVEVGPEVLTQLDKLPERWTDCKKLANQVSNDVAPLQADEVAKLKRKANQFDVRNFEFREDFVKRAPTRYDAQRVYQQIDNHYREYLEMDAEMSKLAESATLFNVKLPEYKQLRACKRELIMLKNLWDMVFVVRSEFAAWKTTKWKEVNVENMEMECKRFVKEIRKLDKESRAWEAFNGVDNEVKNMITSLGAVGLLQSPSIRDRHWQQLMQATGVKIVMTEDTRLADLLALNLHNFEDDVATIVDRANKEQGMEKTLRELDATWSALEFEYDTHKSTGTPLLKTSEELIETLEDNQVQIQNLMTSKYIAYFLEDVSGWQKKLSTADSVIEIYTEVQRTWSHLESIFIGSEDIRQQLPEDSKRFDTIDVDFKEVAHDAAKTPNVIEATNKAGLYEKLENIQSRLGLCEKSLQEYLETKRLAFPRFYFVSGADLLDILSNGNNPPKVAKQLAKLFTAMGGLKQPDDDPNTALGMYATDGEYVEFTRECVLQGRVEDWLNHLLDVHRDTLRDILAEAVVGYEEKPRREWVFDYPAQISLTGTQIWWATEVTIAFSRLEEGFETAMKEYNKKQVSLLNDLIRLLQGKLSKAHRRMLQTICTIDVHCRDVVIHLINVKAESAEAFDWQCQLRHIWDEQAKLCRVHICDARFNYAYEYLGNVPRLVVTPLTDRCYITLTQSLHLIMSGAPAGPAGTGKTETTKDLSRCISLPIYVFNCSEQMDYKSVGNIYKGLAQSGAWGCFDEFNRISVEVLSVVAVQVKTIQDAIRAKKQRFNFLGEVISLTPSVGIFITMNPGYAGRTELPENIKALFRPCAMVVPDYGMICEIMLVSEGFLDAKLLARKFITLYTLNRDLLSKQDHYDWGLRAIKSVLVVAGALKRADPDRSEEEVLMRALRDFNIPKIVNEDLPVFMGLIGDLFPGLDVPRKRDMDFEKTVREAVLSLGYQAEDSFLLKIVQLQELLDVRHSVFVLGPAATGKTGVLRSLNKTYQLQGRKPIWADLNPKAVTNHELYGYINLATREWVDGLFSHIMRDIANSPGDSPKWMVLDGDIDTMWIESLNTVMDDNKVLTLASNERIALQPSMRLLFEIANLTYASPATVSRAGILFVNPTDLGWNPFVASWIETLESPGQRTNLMILFEKYVPPCLDALRTRFKTITPMTEWSMVNTLCHLLELLLTPEHTPEGCPKEDYELFFAWAAVWAFGGQLFKDQLVDWREEFSKWWVTEFKTVKFPSSGTVFDYYINKDKKFCPWSELVQPMEYDPEVPMSSALVPTTETVRVRYWMDLLVDAGQPVLLVGSPGTGKTATILDKLRSLNSDEWIYSITSFNHYTTHHTIQGVLEEPLEKKAGKNFGPPGTKRLVYFVDDLNMPEVDLYGTASPHTVMRQHLDYDHWYDRQKHTLKIVSNTQYMASMNPKAGSFTINPRLQRHFTVFAISPPGDAALTTIYTQLLTGHLKNAGFSKSVLSKAVEPTITAAIKIHTKASSTFLPTAIKFHYVFNLRDLTNVFQGIAFSTGDTFKTPLQVARLLLHECERVYSDKLVTEEDLVLFKKFSEQIMTESFPDLEAEQLLAEPRIHTHFAGGIGEPKYKQVSSMQSLNTILNEALSNYNDVNSAMNLVLFRDAMQHVCRINRILESPRGNALLVGVGGSGKQSLSRLAASISGLDAFQITLSKGYGINELKADLASCYIKAGQKGQGVMFLMTDSQVGDEGFLVLINDLLASGEIPGLFADDEKAEIVDGVRGEVKSAGMQDTTENCWAFFIDRVRRLLKVVLCFSPVGDTLRKRARKFPAIVNCTSIDWFHEWPEDALVSVSRSFLGDVEQVPEDLKDPISQFMAYVHGSVNEMSQTFLANERRHNYTTPKSFLEQIALYQHLLEQKHTELQNAMDRMENGLTKLKSTAAQVDDLKEKLKAQEIELDQKNREADALIEKVGVETEKVNKEKEVAAVEQEKVRVINEDVSAKQKSCEEDLAKAEPALVAAQEALNTLNKNNLTELKSFGAPPAIVVTVSAAVMCLLAPGKVPKDRSWKAAKAMMGNVTEFLDKLLNYDKENIPEPNLKAVYPYLKDPEFDPDFVRGKSLAAAGLCAWARNIVTFYEIFCDVEPKRQALAAANAQLEAAQTKLNKIMDKIKKLDEALHRLQMEFQEATDAKLKCQAEADATNRTISLANRLVGGLASEKERWGEAVQNFKQQGITLPGDVLMVTAFISYTGCFTKKYRDMLYNERWVPFLKSGLKSPIPCTEGLDPLAILTDNAQVASWQNEDLPADRVSTENATILLNAKRWPLIIDPQEQGIKWIKKREGEDLRVVRLGQKGYLDTIERAVGNGDCLLIENLGEDVEPVLDNLLGRQLIKKGRAVMIGDKEVEYSPTFRLILHTKMANPHYKPELQAQCTLINFTVTQSGLEDQLLADVVTAERPDLQETKAKLTQEQNQYAITLKELEDALLARLSSAEGDFLQDEALVVGLEDTKKTAEEIAEKVKEAKVTEEEINRNRELYRPAAARAALLYFIINELDKIHPMYQISLKAFKVVFAHAISISEPAEEVKARVDNITETITFSVFNYVSRGLFERDKLIFSSQMALQILAKRGEIVPAELEFLLKAPSVPNVVSPVDFMSHASWGNLKALSALEAFANLDRDVEGSAKRWKKFCESEVPEKEKFPGEWKNKTLMQRLCMMRCFRPDRMLYAMSLFVAEVLGEKYTAGRVMEFSRTFEETSRATGVFFILSPGVNPILQVEQLGNKLGFAFDNNNYHQVSLGQGQEVVAENALTVAAEKGHWVVLENIHLVKKWLPSLEKKLEQCSLEAHDDFRYFLTAEPASTAASHIIPQGILEACIKITNEPPTGIQANLHAALDNFNQDTLEMCAKENEFRKLLFSLVYFHAVVLERRKFGPMGWNRNYPFNTGDLTISCNVLLNYLESNNTVPWTDLRYLFGEIMYGGHITDNLDRRLCNTYLMEFMRPEMLDTDLELAPGFLCPNSMEYNEYHEYIDENLPPESPYLYWMHPNAEIEFLTVTSQRLFSTVLELQPRETAASGGEGAGQTREEKIKAILDDILEKLPEEFNMLEFNQRLPAEERTPYSNVAFQETARMNKLTNELRRQLKELDLGLKGELTITEAMEELSHALELNKVPANWESMAYPSTKPLGPWYADLLERIKFLEAWSTDFALPAVVWLGGLFNPQSFLTAILQQTARKNEWPLDKMCMNCDVTKKYNKEDFTTPPREGSYICGLFMEGARWDTGSGIIQDARLKELTPTMPILYLKAIPVEKRDTRNIYECPTFKTKERGRANEQVAVGVCPGFVWSFDLRTKAHPNKWTLAGVALLLSD
ncbi:outer dynein arm heavy chain beta [Salpingoeca rosetta]|uniref:Outer dynein arm heavy chain beta n=1 Tax=Salpingoeca rosetta (strain ATCC 50818 / BSB-021) TaxID=946362 RepID=F2UNH5_SALR5|nr:outer dynein arm heavy chain beta [Salpingoeca rosetta]EGD79180.1 outer dynein arm heavy chain beta [Salpingoeca rosetta]|eukprot:XP_004989265.1 outer dynein arm heavy chain beta [Salpingoeca rosetta]